MGWRASTIDVDLRIEAEVDSVFDELPRLKDELRLNIELASPSDFIPEVPGWRDRSVFVERHGSVDFFHYDFYAQALAKLERRHALDLEDVASMFRSGLVEKARLRELFRRIEPGLGRFPAVDPAAFRTSVLTATAPS
jgi:hypothetical protein